MMYFLPPVMLIVTVLLPYLSLCVEQMDSLTSHHAEHPALKYLMTVGLVFMMFLYNVMYSKLS